MTLPLQRKGRYRGVWTAFWFCLLGSAMIFLPFQIVDGGLFIYAGDFNSQQISFWQYANDFIKQGGGQFSWATDLGSSFVNSYSFYLLGSPFFWFSLLFPSSWLPYLMCPLLCLKFAVAGAGAFLWLRRYSRGRNMAIIGACLYAFSGFTIYNVFFNHFVDVIALFPFLLWSLDEMVLEKRYGWFAVFVALNLVNNYFFFAGQVVFLLLYFFVKLLSGEYSLSLSHFGCLALEAVLGVLMGAVLLWPAMLSLSENPRTVDLSSGFGFLLYSKVQQYFGIFYSLFLPPDPCYMPNVFTDGVFRHTSMTAYLPVVSMCGVLAYLRSRPRTALRRLLFLCFLMAMVPVLNSSFYALNSSYYARWYYMPILLMCAATVQAIEQPDIDLKWGMRATLAITLSFAVFGLVPVQEDGSWSLGVAEYASKFWLTMLQALLALTLFWMVVTFWKGHRRFTNALLAAVMGFSVFYSVLHIAMGKFPQWEGDKGYREEMYLAKTQVQLEDDGFCRIDTAGAQDNVGIWLDKSNLRFFNSTVAPSIMEFYPSIGVKRDVSSKPAEQLSGETLNALRSFLGCRYLLAPLDDTGKALEQIEGQIGWTRQEDQGAYAIWENENALPIGFAFDSYVTMEQFDGLSDGEKVRMLLRAIVLDDEQAAEYGDLAGELPQTEWGLSASTLQEDIDARRAHAMTDVWADQSGFGGRISLDRDSLVLFTVPYDSGFSATVNGEPAEVLRVDHGLMAVECPAGESTIVFSYETPLFEESIWVAAGAAAVFAVYLVLVHRKRRKLPAQKGETT